MPAPPPFQQITAVILAGGLGRRVDGQDKGLVVYRGEPLCQHVARILRPQVGHLILSANRSHDTYRKLGFSPVADRRTGFTGPLAGVETALTLCNTPYLLVCPCDTPHLPGDFVCRLWSAMQQANADMACAWDGQREHYLHLLLRVTAAADLSDYLDGGQRTVRHWLSGKVVARALFSEDDMVNMNTLPVAPSG